jgi:hypothetical protein
MARLAATISSIRSKRSQKVIAPMNWPKVFSILMPLMPESQLPSKTFRGRLRSATKSPRTASEKSLARASSKSVGYCGWLIVDEFLWFSCFIMRCNSIDGLRSCFGCHKKLATSKVFDDPYRSRVFGEPQDLCLGHSSD